MSRPFPHVDGVRHEFADVATGVRLHYALAGPDDGEPVVLLHGWPQHWYAWRHVMGPLASKGGYRVIAVDLRGFGWSDAPRSSYSKEELAGDVLALLDVLGLSEGVRLCGHDWGGFTGFLCCLREPSRFRSFLALSIIHPWPNRVVAPRQIATVLAYQPLISTPVIGPFAQRHLPYYRAVFAAGGLSRFLDPAEQAAFIDPFREPDRAEAASRVYRTFLLREAAVLRDRYRTSHLSVPTRLLVPRAEGVITEASVRGGEKHGDDFEIEMVDGTHWIPDEQPELVVERVVF